MTIATLTKLSMASMAQYFWQQRPRPFAFYDPWSAVVGLLLLLSPLALLAAEAQPSPLPAYRTNETATHTSCTVYADTFSDRNHPSAVIGYIGEYAVLTQYDEAPSPPPKLTHRLTRWEDTLQGLVKVTVIPREGDPYRTQGYVFRGCFSSNDDEAAALESAKKYLLEQERILYPADEKIQQQFKKLEPWLALIPLFSSQLDVLRLLPLRGWPAEQIQRLESLIRAMRTALGRKDLRIVLLTLSALTETLADYSKLFTDSATAAKNSAEILDLKLNYESAVTRMDNAISLLQRLRSQELSAYLFSLDFSRSPDTQKQIWNRLLNLLASEKMSGQIDAAAKLLVSREERYEYLRHQWLALDASSAGDGNPIDFSFKPLLPHEQRREVETIRKGEEETPYVALREHYRKEPQEKKLQVPLALTVNGQTDDLSFLACLAHDEICRGRLASEVIRQLWITETYGRRETTKAAVGRELTAQEVMQTEESSLAVQCDFLQTILTPQQLRQLSRREPRIGNLLAAHARGSSSTPWHLAATLYLENKELVFRNYAELGGPCAVYEKPWTDRRQPPPILGTIGTPLPPQQPTLDSLRPALPRLTLTHLLLGMDKSPSPQLAVLLRPQQQAGPEQQGYVLRGCFYSPPNFPDNVAIEASLKDAQERELLEEVAETPSSPFDLFDSLRPSFRIQLDLLKVLPLPNWTVPEIEHWDQQLALASEALEKQDLSRFLKAWAEVDGMIVKQPPFTALRVNPERLWQLNDFWKNVMAAEAVVKHGLELLSKARSRSLEAYLFSRVPEEGPASADLLPLRNILATATSAETIKKRAEALKPPANEQKKQPIVADLKQSAKEREALRRALLSGLSTSTSDAESSPPTSKVDVPLPVYTFSFQPLTDFQNRPEITPGTPDLLSSISDYVLPLPIYGKFSDDDLLACPSSDEVCLAVLASEIIRALAAARGYQDRSQPLAPPPDRPLLAPPVAVQPTAAKTKASYFDLNDILEVETTALVHQLQFLQTVFPTTSPPALPLLYPELAKLREVSAGGFKSALWRKASLAYLLPPSQFAALRKPPASSFLKRSRPAAQWLEKVKAGIARKRLSAEDATFRQAIPELQQQSQRLLDALSDSWLTRQGQLLQEIQLELERQTIKEIWGIYQLTFKSRSVDAKAQTIQSSMEHLLRLQGPHGHLSRSSLEKKIQEMIRRLSPDAPPSKEPMTREQAWFELRSSIAFFVPEDWLWLGSRYQIFHLPQQQLDRLLKEQGQHLSFPLHSRGGLAPQVSYPEFQQRLQQYQALADRLQKVIFQSTPLSTAEQAGLIRKLADDQAALIAPTPPALTPDQPAFWKALAARGGYLENIFRLYDMLCTAADAAEQPNSPTERTDEPFCPLVPETKREWQRLEEQRQLLQRQLDQMILSALSYLWPKK